MASTARMIAAAAPGFAEDNCDHGAQTTTTTTVTTVAGGYGYDSGYGYRYRTRSYGGYRSYGGQSGGYGYRRYY